MLEVRNLTHMFGDHLVLDGLSFAIPPQTLCGFIGPGGSGKSLLLKIIAGLIKPTEGQIFLKGQIADTKSQGLMMSLMFQEGALFDSISVYDNVAFPLVAGKVPTTCLDSATQEEAHIKISEILSRVGLSKAAKKIPGQLSGGMRKRVALARALVARPEYVLLDDPTAGLDPVASSIIMDLIVELYREYKPTTIIVSHDLRRLLPVVDHLVALFEGTVTYQGSMERLRATLTPQSDVNTHPEQLQPDRGMLRKFIGCRYDLQ